MDWVILGFHQTIVFMLLKRLPLPQKNRSNFLCPLSLLRSNTYDDLSSSFFGNKIRRGFSQICNLRVKTQFKVLCICYVRPLNFVWSLMNNFIIYYILQRSKHIQTDKKLYTYEQMYGQIEGRGESFFCKLFCFVFYLDGDQYYTIII